MFSLFERVDVACEAKNIRELTGLREEVRAAMRDTSGKCCGCRGMYRELLANITEVLHELAEEEAREILHDADCARLEGDFHTAYARLQRLQPGGAPYLLAALERNRQLRALFAAVKCDLRQDWCLCGTSPARRISTFHSPDARRVLGLRTLHYRTSMKRRTIARI